MKTVTVGCGKVGSAIIKSLSEEGHEVVAVDSDKAAVEAVTDSFDVMGVCASGTDFETLRDIGMKDTELFIASTGSDELNMLSCLLAKRMGARHTAARIRDTGSSAAGTAFIKSELQLDLMINPELLTAQAIFNLLKYPAAVKSETFTRRSFEMAELIVKPDSALDGALLSELRAKNRIPFLICAVLRDKKPVIPNGSFRLHAGDKIGIIAQPEDLQRLLKGLGILGKRSRYIMVLGASRIAARLSEMLLKSGNSVKIIEKDRDKCNALCEYLPDSASVICGDGTSHELLSEEGIDRTDAFVALTGMDEENILVSFYALSRGVSNVIAKVNRCGYGEISRSLGLDCLVSPKSITADLITSYARALENSVGSQVETLYSLLDGQFEALEFRVCDSFLGCGISIKNLRLRPDILIAGIIRGSEKIIPCGDDIIMPEDKVIVISSGLKLCDLSEILL